MKADTLTVLVVEPEQPPYVKSIEDDLRSLQAEVGGSIEAIYPFDDPVAIICNEEGKMLGLPLNRALRDEDHHVYDVVAGTFLVAGLGSEDFCSLNEKQIEKYSEHFKTPELFLRINDGGHYAPGGYVADNRSSFIEHYTGRDDIPDEHRVFSMPKLSIREQMSAFKEIIDRSSLEGERKRPTLGHTER